LELGRLLEGLEGVLAAGVDREPAGRRVPPIRTGQSVGSGAAARAIPTPGADRSPQPQERCASHLRDCLAAGSDGRASQGGDAPPQTGPDDDAAASPRRAVQLSGHPPPEWTRARSGAGRDRSAVHLRSTTAVVPPGHLVRHPRCPRCREPLAYQVDGGAARYLHADDPRFRMTPVPCPPRLDLDHDPVP
jgi:hypothetical protein